MHRDEVLKKINKLVNYNQLVKVILLICLHFLNS